MFRAIVYAKKIIERQVKNGDYDVINSYFTKYQKGFYWTNENIGCYLNAVNLEGMENALTVAGSGDIAFNLINKGINNVDTFDINRLTEYFILGLKRTMILKYNYYDFLFMINRIADKDISLEELTSILISLTKDMDFKYKLFWEEILGFNYHIQKIYGTNLNLMMMLYVGTNARMSHLNNNSYLLDPYCYEEFRRKLGMANISFKGVDAIDLTKKYRGKKYDLILLSNVLDYADGRWGSNWNKEQLEEYLKSLESITNDDGVIFVKYIINYITEKGFKEQIFYDSSLSREDVDDPIVEIPKHTSTTISDGVILRRVKIDK